MVECFENDHKVNSKCFICNSIIVLLRDDLNTVYIYALHDFNELMSAMSIDGIWQNNLITLFLRLDRMQLASLVYVSVSMLANCIFPTHHRTHIDRYSM